jgi:hypothetical protein
MKTRIRISLAACAVALLVVGFSARTQAQIYIPSGSSISFIGGATLNGPIASATGYSTIFSTSVLPGSQTGAYASVPDSTSVTFNPFTFSPSPTSAFQLWTFSVGNTSYSFEVDANSVSIAHQDATFLNITGTGEAQITGYTDTPGTWSLTDTGLGSAPVFTFGASTTVVPEPSAAMFLGLGAFLLLIVTFRKKARV